ncbi:alpha/beta hydrolase [Rubrimonas sp.]|uniref:alpha/beta hydrolase n=1 Tax=Rubrimonas sp. TaxID=2036015 RepID=UPI002FDD26EC
MSSRCAAPEPAIADWDAAYSNSGAVPEAPAIFARWTELAAGFRAQAPGALDLPYGPHPRERLDLFSPAGAAKGLLIYIHGGYWRAFDKSGSSHLAAGPLARGWAVAIPSYPLCPEVRIADIAASVARAVEAVAARVAGPIVLSGHSAGGHLAARLVCEGAPLAAPVADRVALCVGISGVYDLRPLLRTAMNADLRLDPAQCAAESPALLAPRDGARLVAWVGEDELPEFRRQSALIANVWRGLGAATACVEAPGRHHFDVVDDLADPDSALAAALDVS